MQRSSEEALMSVYAKRSIIYVAALVLIVGLWLLMRTESVSENLAWNSATSTGTAKAYREYVGKWRTGKHAAAGLEEWEKALKREYGRLDWTSPYAVEVFIESHPEVRESDIRKVQYETVIKNGSYEVLMRYLEKLPQLDSRRDEVEKYIDAAAMAEVKSALARNDFQELRKLSIKYSDWRGRQEWIDDRIPTARDNSAKAEWARLVYSRSEQELRRFIKLRIFYP